MPHIHVANSPDPHHDQNVQVFISKRLTWLVRDLVWDIFSLVDGLEELKLATSPEEIEKLPKAIHTVSDLLKTLRHCVKIKNKWNDVRAETKKAANDFLEAFKKTSITIPIGHFEDVKAVKGLGWMNPSAVGGFLGFKTFHVIVQTEDGKKIVDFKSQHDQSWVVTGSGVVRQKYGAGLFVQDLSKRQYPWGAESTPAPRPVAKNNGYLWCVQNGTNRPLTFYRHDEAGFISDVTNRKGTVEPSEFPKLAAGATNDWTASWEVTLPPSSSTLPPPPPQGPNDAFGMNFGIDTYTNESRGLAFHIPRKFARGSEMKVIIKEKDESELIIEYPEHRTKQDSTEDISDDPVYIKRTFYVLNKGLPRPDYGTLKEKPEFPDYDGYLWRITNGRGGSPDDSTHDISIQAGEENSVGQDGYGYPTPMFVRLRSQDTYGWGEGWEDTRKEARKAVTPGCFPLSFVVFVFGDSPDAGEHRVVFDVPNEFLRQSELTVIIRDPLEASVVQAYHPTPTAATISASKT